MVAVNKAFESLCRLLQGRDHSECELRRKLAARFSADEIDSALQEACQRGLLLAPATLSENFARSWHRRNKGFVYIQQQLRQKGLPAIERNEELEVQKARIVLQKLQGSTADGAVGVGVAFGGGTPSSSRGRAADKARLSRQLIARGFDFDTVKQVLNRP